MTRALSVDDTVRGDIYDYRRLLEAVTMRRELPAFQQCQEIIEEVQRFSGGVMACLD